MTTVLESVGAIPVGEVDLQGSAVAIPLRAKDGTVRAFTFVDRADYEWVSEHRWFLKRAAGDRIGYAARSVRIDGKQQTEFLHRRILGLERGDRREGDHRDRNSLNNQRSNLRVVTHAANGQNTSGRVGRTSKYRGVYLRKDKAPPKSWGAMSRANGRQVHLGFFETEQEAADVAARFREIHMPYSQEASK